jgi:hypothetical protein
MRAQGQHFQHVVQCRQADFISLYHLTNESRLGITSLSVRMSPLVTSESTGVFS